MSERQRTIREHVFTLPDLGEGLTEAEVVRWLVAVGDVVIVDQAIVEVETAKSIVEVPTPYAGRVAELHGKEGETVDVGKPLISVTAPETVSAAKPQVEPAAETYREEEQAGSGNVLIGYGTSDVGGTSRRRRRPRTGPEPTTPSVATIGATVSRVTSPLVRNLARSAGIAIREIPGSGTDGLITRRDVQAAIGVSSALTAPNALTAPTAPTMRTGMAVAQRTPMNGFRKAVSAALTRSRGEIPEATVWVDVDFTELFALRESAKLSGDLVPSLMAYLARFTVAALRAYPDLNGEVDSVRQELIQYADVNLGLAVQTDRGLVVPAVMAAHQLTTTEIDNEIRRVTVAARDGKATQVELTGGTFTLNNYGSFNVDGSAAIINHPQVAILGFGRIIDKPWVVNGAIVIRKIGQMSFVFDHRVCDGGTAAGFMRLVAGSIERPLSAISHL